MSRQKLRTPQTFCCKCGARLKPHKIFSDPEGQVCYICFFNCKKRGRAKKMMEVTNEN